jgi:putative PEP-CTERM system histidine kinase
MAAPFQVSVVSASALLAAMIGLFAAFRRGHFLTTLLFSSAFFTLAALQAGTIGILEAPSPTAARAWATYLAGVSALASWLWLALSLVLARTDPWLQIRKAGAYLMLALIGCSALFFAAGTTYVVREVIGIGGAAVIVLGPMGRLYLMYLVVVMVAVVMNFERMLRMAPAAPQRRLRAMFMAFLIGIFANLLVVSGGLLFGGVRVAWMVASAAPMFVSGTVTALALARRRLSDMSVPVARPVIYYSSVSLTLAGAFLLTMAVMAKVLPVLTPEWKRGVSLAFYVLVGGGGLVFVINPRISRAVKRFIDRNFYANRYDYRREWERVSSAITPSARPEDLCRQIETLVGTVFDAQRIAIYLLDDALGAAGSSFRRVHGPPVLPERMARDNPLVQELERQRTPLLLRDIAQDLDLLRIMVENREMIHAIPAAVCAPLAVGDVMIGVMFVAEKRADEEYSYEDVEFLAAMSRQLAAALWFARQGEQLAETRQLESLNRLSTFVLHDIKNHVSGLSLVVENARQHLANPDFQRDALAVLERTVTNLRELMAQVSAVARAPEVRAEDCALPELMRDALHSAGLRSGDDSPVRVRMSCPEDLSVSIDRRLVLRLMVNLLTNAREALNGSGSIDLTAELKGEGADGRRRLLIEVRDTGRGMTDEFIRSGLFKPFATTKSGGLGIGLTQCRSIVEAHGGTIEVESHVGAGTRFLVDLPIDPMKGAAS